MQTPLGTLARIDDIRSIWPHEANDFTPWLAEQANIDRLSETLGLDLEVQFVEHAVGNFFADIVCKDVNTENMVLIENQLEKTNHAHLGQILTYAAGTSAVTIIWIATRFQDEHRAALDWLNENTPERINFFGIEIEVYRIGDSLPAPLFKIVSQPNNWFKIIRQASDNPVSSPTSTQALQLEYWQSFRNYMIDNKSSVKPRSAHAQHWIEAAIGNSRNLLNATVNTQKNIIATTLLFRGPNADQRFDALRAMYESEANKYFDSNIAWEPNHGTERWIIIRKFDTDPKNVADWQNQHQWLKEQMEKLNSYFRDKLQILLTAPYNK